MALTLLALCAAPVIAQPAAGGPDRVRVASGILQGTRSQDGQVRVFKGVPYAAAPVGPLRLRPPAPPPRWPGVRRADSFGALCPQLGNVPPDAVISEDCLTANIWTGATSARERRPVFVWIYGGGFSMGTGSNPQFDGEMLARKGVVVVTFNYRLGPLGFLATPELSRESGHKASGNYGLLDDIAMLRWVQRNITAFGGDPSRVTIGGQSAGAGSAGFLAISPLARGLFHRTIAQSHARHPGDPELRYLSTSWRELGAAEAAGQAFVEARGARTAAELRALPWQTLLEGSDLVDSSVDSGSNSRPPLFRPVVDGWVVPQRLSATYAAGAQNPVLFLAGSNHDETGAVPDAAVAPMRANPPEVRGGMPTVNVTLATYVPWAQRKFGVMAAEFLRLYPASNDDEAARMNNQAARDNSRSSTFLWAGEWRKRSALPVYTYFWTRGRAGPEREMRGAFHGSEVGYVFNTLHKANLPWSAEDRRAAETMSSYWANYIASGNPNGPGLPVWPTWDAGKPQVMELGTGFAPIPVASPERLDFWRRFFASQPQW